MSMGDLRRDGLGRRTLLSRIARVAAVAAVALPMSAGALLGSAGAQERRILEAALDLFVERGFHATTIPEIARRAGLAAGTIYLYFPGKEALVNAILVRMRTCLGAMLAAALPRAPRGTRAEFEGIWAVFSRFALECERGMAFCDLHHHAQYVDAGAHAARAPTERLLEAHFQAGRRAGRYRDLEPSALRAAVAGVLLGMNKFARAGQLRLDAGLLAEAREMAWRAVTRAERSEA